MGVVANAFMVREVNLTDPRNFLGSANMHAIARAHGLWDGRGALDFTAAFSDGEYLHKYYSGRRVWGAYRMLAPSRELPAEYSEWRSSRPYPPTLRPDAKVGIPEMAAVMRSYYEGTPYDQTMGLAAGPWGTPDHAMAGGSAAVRGNWERTIGLFRTSDSHVVQARAHGPDALRGILWWGAHAAPTTVYVPFPSGMRWLPHLTLGHYEQLDKRTLFWACRYVFNVVQLKYSRMAPEVRRLQEHMHARAVELLDKVGSEPGGAPDDLESAFATHAAAVLDSLWKLVDLLIFKFGDGFLAELSADGTYTAKTDPYPDWWLRAVNYSAGPPPVPAVSVG